MTVFIIIDLFCGAGGVTEGFEQAEIDGVKFIVIAGVNHDQKAIESHAKNHPNTKHFIEDVRNMSVVYKLKKLVEAEKARLEAEGHTVFVILHASMECTNFSNAKGGKPRDADSRSLPEYMPWYVEELNPDFFTVENVREFMSWGPLDEKGKPLDRKRGRDYLNWVHGIEQMGYNYSFRLMNAADFGAYTSRLRYFGLFIRHGLPSAWPEPTHAKNPKESTMFEKKLEKWKPVRDVLRLEEKGKSIFGRKIPPVEKTLERLYAGLVKHVAKGDLTFLAKYYSGNPAAKCISINEPSGAMTTTDSHSLVSAEPFIVKSLGNNQKTGINNGKSIDDPSISLTTQIRQQLVTPEPFLMTYNSGYDNNRVRSLDDPCPVVTTENAHAVVSPEFLLKYYGNEKEGHSLDMPCGTVTTKDRLGLISVENFLLGQTSSAQLKSVDETAPTLLTDCNNRMVTIEKQWLHDYKHENEARSLEEPAPTITTVGQHYLVTTNHGGNTHSVENPSPVIIARQDKAPIGLVSTIEGSIHWEITSEDSPAMIKIKQFMKAYGIADIFMRMLFVEELLAIQGFPKHYVLQGTQTDQKKFIGNSVVPRQMKVWAEALATAILIHLRQTGQLQQQAA